MLISEVVVTCSLDASPANMVEAWMQAAQSQGFTPELLHQSGPVEPPDIAFILIGVDIRMLFAVIQSAQEGKPPKFEVRLANDDEVYQLADAAGVV